MKICFVCDLHLPFDKKALQYDALNWAVEDISKKSPDCIVCAGDVTCDGNEAVYDEFVDLMNSLGFPFLYIPGNSDLQNRETYNNIKTKSSPCKTTFGDTTIYALNDSEQTLSEEQFAMIEAADRNSIVFMHHPMEAFDKSVKAKLEGWLNSHRDTMLFYAHNHCSSIDKNYVSLQSMDPDKAGGENPCITYYDTETKMLRKAYYFSPVPNDIYNYFGISCYNSAEQINFAIKHQLKNIELRPTCVELKQEDLLKAAEQWRMSGGETLSIHLPDVECLDGKVKVDESYQKLIDIVKLLKADRVTQHMPAVSVREVKNNPEVLNDICDFLAEKLNSIPHNIVIGIENMHMTPNETPDENRHFGYIPEECLQFMQMLDEKCNHKVGINFDIGHVINNSPFSQKYQISTWLSILGKYVVGYNLYQVGMENNVFQSHMPITDIYGPLISFASFFKCWQTEQINKAPVIFEMHPENAYETTLKTFEFYRKRRVFDIHSHTYYSACGRDNPHDLVRTAIQNGISLLGISDHNYGIGDRKKDYYKEIRMLAEEYKEKIKILCGIEIATYPHLYDIDNSDEIKDFDYCLIEHITASESIVQNNLFEFCSKLGIPCGIAHTDLFAYCDMYGFEYKDFFKDMAKNNIFWEMNVSYDSIHKYNEHQYVLDFMKDAEKINIIKNAGVHISVGFDSHREEDYDGYKVHSMYDFLKANNIKTADALLW